MRSEPTELTPQILSGTAKVIIQLDLGKRVFLVFLIWVRYKRNRYLLTRRKYPKPIVKKRYKATINHAKGFNTPDRMAINVIITPTAS